MGCRQIAGGEASNELVETIRSNMDPSEQNATDGVSSVSNPSSR